MSNVKYLGTLIDNKLSFSDNSDLIYKKSQQRLYFLRKLRSFDVSRELLQIVYKSLVESVLTFNIVVWYGNLDVNGKAFTARYPIVPTASARTQSHRLPCLNRKMGL